MKLSPNLLAAWDEEIARLRAMPRPSRARQIRELVARRLERMPKQTATLAQIHRAMGWGDKRDVGLTVSPREILKELCALVSEGVAERIAPRSRGGRPKWRLIRRDVVTVAVPLGFTNTPTCRQQ